MRLGVEIFPSRGLSEAIELARKAEDLGFAMAWIGDSQCIWGELHVALGAIAASTTSIGIGSSVTNFATRHISVVASAWAAISQLEGRQVILGVGTGDSAVRTIGRKPLSIADLESSVLLVRRLLNGEQIEDPETGALFGLEIGARVRLPIYIAASSPRMMRLAGRIADGVITLPGVQQDVIHGALEATRAGAAESGRKLSDLEVVLSTPLAISGDGETARRLVRSHVARAALRPLPSGFDDSEVRETIERLRAQYDYRQHLDIGAAHAKLVPERLIEMFAVAGTPDECAEQLQRIASLGIDQLAVIPYVGERESRSDLLATVARLVA